MARRRKSGEVNIGSDSFLDVIANIVGVLIILIVIAGVQGGREVIKRPKRIRPAAVEAESSSTTEAADAEDLAASAEFDEPEFVERTTPPEELTEQIKAIRSELKTIEVSVSASEKDKSELERRQAAGELEITTGRRALLTEKSKHEARSRTAEEYAALISSQKKNLGLLQTQLEELEKSGPQSKKLKHRVTPLSRIVEGEQLHFRLSANHVSQVPIRELLEAALRQAKKHGEELSRGRTYTGTVGPTDGYFLQYKIKAIPPSAGEAARYGPGMMRIVPSSFELNPDADLREESTEEALARGSVFDIAMQTAEPGSTFTLWVYPDSFQLYRQLQAKLHDAGFTVAGRPLPIGIPIACSPDGSASAGQ